MLRYLLDTNLCIRLPRDRPQGLRARFNAEADVLATSTVVPTESLHGAAKSERTDRAGGPFRSDYVPTLT